MPRLFTGIELPEELIWRLSMMRAGLNGARWLDPDNYHITLRFGGDMPDFQANAFAEALDDVHFDSFDLELSGLGSFGGNKPRSIWLGVKSSPALHDLHRAHERAARIAGLPPEPRNFTPHITLARLKNTSPFAVADYLARHGYFFSAPITVSRFVLLSSRPNIGGGPYVVEEGYAARNWEYLDEDEAAA